MGPPGLLFQNVEIPGPFYFPPSKSLIFFLKIAHKSPLKKRIGLLDSMQIAVEGKLIFPTFKSPQDINSPLNVCNLKV